MRVLVLSEYYPRAGDPTLGVWAHRQTVATRDAGVDLRVLVLHRPVPPLAAIRRRDLGAIRRALGQPARAELDGIRVDYVRYLSPPRPWSYATWGAWAARPLAAALRRVHREFPFDLIHAHYAVPSGDAARRAAPQVPLVVSVHGGDVHGPQASSRAVAATLRHARLVLANSAGTARRCAVLGADPVRVVHLGTDPAPATSPVDRGDGDPASGPTLVTVGNLIARKRHADVIAALPSLLRSHPGLRYVIVGEGPERERLAALAVQLGVVGQVEFRGRLGHEQATAVARSGSLFVLPSLDEAFGVSYVEAMAGGVPAIGIRGEDGPEEIAAAGGGIALVPGRDPVALAGALDGLLADRARREALGQAARENVERNFTWAGCGAATLAAYREVLGR
ncbi:MAG: glycosyltransferase [Solirubrobacteraceae bacterium]